MTSNGFRRIVLAFPETSEGAHMGHPDFRVRGKIFATIWPDDGWGMVKLTPEDQRAFVRANPRVFVPVKGAWGRRGATNVRLAAAKSATVRLAVLAAWCSVAPERLVLYAPYFKSATKRNRGSRRLASPGRPAALHQLPRRRHQRWIPLG